MLILGYGKKFTLWSLLLMIIFFTFLTFYSAYFNKVTDCGCFGDALPLTPWESFWKDVVLTVFILILFIKSKYFQPLFQPASANKWIVFLVFIGCLGFTYHVLMHLPAIDFRAYKEGVKIEEGMVPKEGEVIPSIHDFGFYNQGGDDTDKILNQEKVLLVVAYNLSKSENQGWSEIKSAVQKAKKNGYNVVGLSASGPTEIDKVKADYGFDFPFYFTDETAIKTIIRSNPGLVTLENGVIIQKLHYNDADDLEVK
jgi:peroxiredoxin